MGKRKLIEKAIYTGLELVEYGLKIAEQKADVNGYYAFSDGAGDDSVGGHSQYLVVKSGVTKFSEDFVASGNAGTLDVTKVIERAFGGRLPEAGIYVLVTLCLVS